MGDDSLEPPELEPLGQCVDELPLVIDQQYAYQIFSPGWFWLDISMRVLYTHLYSPPCKM
jgi:hypothetical protein